LGADDIHFAGVVGQVPLEWYGEEGHIGYTREGAPLTKRAKGELEGQVAAKDRWRTIYDEYNDEQITLSKEEIALIKRIRQGRFPHVEVSFTPPPSPPCLGPYPPNPLFSRSTAWRKIKFALLFYGQGLQHSDGRQESNITGRGVDFRSSSIGHLEGLGAWHTSHLFSLCAQGHWKFPTARTHRSDVTEPLSLVVGEPVRAGGGLVH